LVFVPAGDCVIGTDADDDWAVAKPQHPVRFSAFFIGRYELTIAQFEEFVRKTGHVTSAERSHNKFTWKNPLGGTPPTKQHPVECVTWNDAHAYCRWAKLRLPTEAEWEKAAAWDPKARKKRDFPWGNERPGPNTPKYANIGDKQGLREIPNMVSPFGE